METKTEEKRKPGRPKGGGTGLVKGMSPSEYQKKWRNENREYLREWFRRYRRKHSEDINEATRARRANDPEYRERERAYRKAYKERMKARKGSEA